MVWRLYANILGRYLSARDLEKSNLSFNSPYRCSLSDRCRRCRCLRRSDRRAGRSFSRLSSSRPSSIGSIDRRPKARKRKGWDKAMEQSMSMHEISRHIMTWLWTSVIAKDRQLHISATQIKLNHGSCTCDIQWIAYCNYGRSWWLVAWWAKNPHDWWRYMWLLQFNASQTEKWQGSERENP